MVKKRDEGMGTRADRCEVKRNGSLGSAYRFGRLSTTQADTHKALRPDGHAYLTTCDLAGRRLHSESVSMEMLTPSDVKIHDIEIPCFRCGVIDHHHVEPGSGPHGAKLVCGHCKNFIRWLPKPREDRGSLPATDKQLHYLKAMAYKGQKPTTRREASRLIGEMKKARGWYE